ncbi:MAG TPA: cation:proton antiporter [Petrimonas sp.]|uniref:cation:proton antiporter n=1 Tax=Petrimonas sp. TaxID=2023866 RepID=UPI00175CF87D|nr:cation:proton antiporter [Petrimonas sp.]MEA4948526.1 cation:proton antiporter [Petrimonas sp.]MEA4978474.1 cation:proton antiporter [Petrimonas sp.]HHV85296.1 cation:proton antiporter [Petrimonas sp.]
MLLALDLTLPISNPTVQFLVLFTIVLVAPIIFNKIKVPSLIGLIIAGAIIGPFGLSVMSRDSNMIMLGNAGLLYIMFLAGIEIDVAEFKKNSSRSLVFGLLTFTIPMVIGIFAGYYLLKLSMISSVLLASMFASHTLIAYPIISKLGAGKNRAVTVAIGGTMITDTLALLVLAVIISMNEGQVTPAFWTQLTLSIIVFTLTVVFLFPIIGRWFFKKFQDSASQFIFVMMMIFLGGFLAELAGIEAIIGAFLAGLAMNKLIPHVSPLMNRIDFVGNAIFIPIFLISVGMLINYRAFVTGFETIKVAIVMTVVAISAKFLAAWATQKIYGYSKAERMLIFGLSNAQAAATLAAVMVGHRVGLLDDNILNGTIVMILVTCTVASFRAQKGAIGLSFAEGSLEDEDAATEERILIPVANKETLKDLVELSLVIKSKANTQDLYALNIIKSTETAPQIEKESQKLLDEAVRLGAGAETIVQPLRRYDMNVLNGILGIVKKYSITDVVMGLHVKQEISESFLGSLIEGVLDKTRSTTFIYKAIQPLSTVKKRLVIIPPNADKEIGFPFWLSKIWNLGRNTGAKLSFYATEHILDILRQINKTHPIDVEFKEFSDWDDFLVLSKEIGKDVGLVIVMSRLRKASYHETMKRIPDYINKYFKSSNFMLLYPIQSATPDDYHNDMTNASLLASIRNLGGFGETILSTIEKNNKLE